MAQLGWAFLISIALGALIGGLTNFLAIAMLFRPHKSWKIGGWKIPFTPGLIPKRREQLAKQLGHVVEEYLFTSEGMLRLIRKGEGPQRVSQFLMERLEKWTESEKTIAECLDDLSQYVPLLPIQPAAMEDPCWQAWFEHLLHLLQQRMRSAQGRTLEGYLGEDGVAWVRTQIPRFSQLLLNRGHEFLNSVSGRRWLVQLLQDFIRTSLRGGRMWNTLASLIVDEERLATWMHRRLVEWLAQPVTKERFDRFLQQQWDECAKKPLGQLRHVLEKEDWLQLLKLLQRLFMDGECLRQIPVNELLRPLSSDAWQQKLRQWLEEVENRLTQFLPVVFRRLRIARVVEQQVLDYPLSQLEKLIVQIASRELKMITWLGALIGGLVGLVQGTWLYLVIG